jgi:hypothetical protein
MPEVMKPHESDDPAYVGLLGAAAIVPEPDRFPDTVEEFGCGNAGRGFGDSEKRLINAAES